MSISNEQIQQVFSPIFDAAYKFAGVQVDGVVQMAKRILAENMEKPIEEKEGEEDGGK